MYLICILLFLVSCEKNPTHFQGIAHTHPYHIQVGHSLSSRDKERIQNTLEETFAEVDLFYNHWNPHSLLSTFPTSPKLKPILALAHSFQELTGGWYDPTLAASIQTFKTQVASPHGYDLDGMLKGYAIDQIVEKLLALGFSSLYVEWGGDLRVHGNHPQGRKWQILVSEKVLPLKNSALATSGSGEQQWNRDGAIYTHIINPFTKEMLKVEKGRIHSVTVQAPTCALADALATACMACGTLEKGMALAQKIKEQCPVEFWISVYE